MPRQKTKVEDAILFNLRNDTHRKGFKRPSYNKGFSKAFGYGCTLNGKRISAEEEQRLLREAGTNA